MADYQKMYYTLFHATEEAIDALAQTPCTAEELAARMRAVQRLIGGQRQCEEIHLEE